MKHLFKKVDQVDIAHISFLVPGSSVAVTIEPPACSRSRQPIKVRRYKPTRVWFPPNTNCSLAKGGAEDLLSDLIDSIKSNPNV